MTFFFYKSIKTVHFICNPGSILNCFLNWIYNRKILQHPLPTYISNYLWTIFELIHDLLNTSVLYPNYINAWIQFADYPLFPRGNVCIMLI